MATLVPSTVAGDFNQNFVIGDRRMVVQVVYITGTYAQVVVEADGTVSAGGIRITPAKLGLNTLQIAYASPVANGVGGGQSLVLAGQEQSNHGNLIFAARDADNGESDAGSLTTTAIVVAFGK